MKNKIPTLRFPEFEGEWTQRRIREFIKERIEFPEKKLPLFSLTIENGVVPKSKRYERGHLVNAEEGAYKIMCPGDFAYNPMNLRFGALAKYNGVGNVMISKYYNVFYCTDKASVGYIEPFLTSYNMLQYYNKMATGTLEEKKRVHFFDFLKFKIPLPTLPEQQKIADFLTAVDDKINRLTRKKTLLEQYKKGVMQKIFSQEIRFPEFEGEWKKQRLGDFLVEYKVRVPSNTKVPVLTSSRSGLFLQKDYFSNRDLQNNGEYGVVPKGYFTYRHMSDDSTFMFNINNLVEKGAISKEYPVFTTKGLNSYFLQQKLNCGIEFKKFAIAQKLGGTRVRLYFKKLIEFKLNLPSLPEQQKIADFLTGIDKKIGLVNTQLEKTKEWKKGLLQQMFV